VRRAGLPPSLPERRLLERYLDLLYAESNHVNLTRVARSDAWARHIEESLDLVSCRNWAPSERVLDLGSGGGLPGIPLAIAAPQLSVGLIERDLAKATFLLHCLGQLGLIGVRVFARDARELARSQGFERADVLVSRAALPALDLLQIARRLLRPGGEGMVHVGPAVSLTEGLMERAESGGLGDLRVDPVGHSRLLRFVRLPAD